MTGRIGVGVERNGVGASREGHAGGRRGGGRWQVTAFRLPGYALEVTREGSGKWRCPELHKEAAKNRLQET